MNSAMINSFSSELIKISQNVFVDPRESEMQERGESPPPRGRTMNREVLKQHLKNIGAIGLGTGLGLGASEGAIYGLEKAYQKLGKNPPPTWVPHAMRAAVIPALAMGAYAAHRGMRDKSNYELEMARRRGLKQQEEEGPKIVGGVPELEGM